MAEIEDIPKEIKEAFAYAEKWNAEADEDLKMVNMPLLSTNTKPLHTSSLINIKQHQVNIWIVSVFQSKVCWDKWI